jgi:hypothetical protein
MLPREEVLVRWRSGNEWFGPAAGFQWHWADEPRPYDIVAYSVPIEVTLDTKSRSAYG